MTPAEVIAAASVAEVNGGELEPIGTIYKPEGVALVIIDALTKAGYRIDRADPGPPPPPDECPTIHTAGRPVQIWDGQRWFNVDPGTAP